MAYALVGSIGTVATGSNSLSPTYAQATSAGNLLIFILVTRDAQGVNSMTQSFVNAVNQLDATNALTAEIWYKANCAAGETAPVATITGGLTGAAGVLAEFSGGATSSPVDTFGGANSATSPDAVTATGTLVEIGELVISSSVYQSTKAETVTTANSYNNGATPTGNLNNDATSIALHYRFAYGITTGTAAQTNSTTNTSMNLNTITSSLATFKLVSVAVTPSLVLSTTVPTNRLM